MNRELEDLVLAYESVSASRDREAERNMEIFEARLDEAFIRCQGKVSSRDLLRKCVILAHRNWALKQDNKPPSIPPKA
jgi:hypothetical protein